VKTIFLLLLPLVVFAQYWGERPNEKSFENSSVYFNSFYLNPYEVYQFDRVSPGLMNDPYLNSYLNPAFIPVDSVSANQLYIDFRGDRSASSLHSFSPITPYMNYDYYYRPDPRWYTVTRSEPEPLFSLGLSKQLSNRLYVNVAYQFIFKEESFYQTPTWIYNARYGRDAMGAALTDESATPIVDRSAGEDGMHTRGHLFAANLAYRLNEHWSAGINFNGVSHQRNGEYGRLRRDEYSSANDGNWFSLYSKKRNNRYYHWAGGAGAQWQISDRLQAGIKLNYLTGRVDQTYSKMDSSIYSHTWQSGSNHSIRGSATSQSWQRDGITKSGLIQLNYRSSKNRSMQFYYQYTLNKTDLQNQSFIRDTSYYGGNYQSGTHQSIYNSWSSLSDVRHANGTFEQKAHQAMLSFRWFETQRTQIHLGFFFSDKFYQTKTAEPVLARENSAYNNTRYDDGQEKNYTNNHYLFEDKTLIWDTKTEKQSLQIPIMFRFIFNKHWSLMVAVNRIWDYWRVEEVTTAYFKVRDKKDNGDTKNETNFGERYTEPTSTISEDKIAFLSGLAINISPKFQINIMASPEFVPEWRVMQWWLGFRIGM